MNIEADLPQIGRLLWRDKFLVSRGRYRIETAWRNILKLSKGPFLAREFTALDAFYASVITRIQAYKLPISKDTALYIQRIRQHPSVKNGVKTQLKAQFIAILKTPIGSTEKFWLIQHRFCLRKLKLWLFA